MSIKILAVGDPHGSLKMVRRIPKKDLDLILLTGDLGKAYNEKNGFCKCRKKKERNV